MKPAISCKASFLKSSEKAAQVPPPDFPEFAFIGRSNVGKSSLINMLTGVPRMAKVSGTPGKTQLLNHFLLELAPKQADPRTSYLCDLPGYGYARVSQKRRSAWTRMTENYLTSRSNLINVFVLIDIRIPAQEIDLDFCKWMAAAHLPFSIVFTKADKIGKTQITRAVNSWKKSFLEEFNEMPHHVATSSENATGRDELLLLLYEWSFRSGEA